MDVKLLSIDSIGLSNRSRNALHKVNVHTVEEMLIYDEEMLYSIRNLGKKSIEEILEKIKEYKKMEKDEIESFEVPENYRDWIQNEEGKQFVLSYLQEKEIKTEELELLSTKAYNILIINGYEFIYQFVFLSKEELFAIPRMDEQLVEEVSKLCLRYLLGNEMMIMREVTEQKKKLDSNRASQSIFDMVHMSEYQDCIMQYVKENDIEIQYMELSNRAINSLKKSGYEKLSEIIFMEKVDFYSLASMGKSSVDLIMAKINEYLSKHEKRIIAFCSGDESALMDDEMIVRMIIKQYKEQCFKGLSFKEILERLQLPSQITEDRVKKIIGSMLSKKELEYVDYRCYRMYDKFEDVLNECPKLEERSKKFIEKRLQGQTLESIAQEYGLTRERVRQVVKRDVEKVRNWHLTITAEHVFDEDYYRYFYATYHFDKEDGTKWLGIPVSTYSYFDMIDVKQGEKNLQFALDDYHNIDTGLRLKIMNYLNRNKVYVDGRWVEKRRATLEEVVVRKFCRNNVSFDQFCQIYNEFLLKEDIAYGEDIYCTEAVYRTRKNTLSEARYLLWKQNEQIRYYDIDARDYTELLDTLNLDAYENIELSTVKFMSMYPEVMEKYDIRDQYELHNLLRKIIPEGSYHDFHCGRMPEIKFGEFDRDAALYEILVDNSPISAIDLANIIQQEYGYDPAVILTTYLQPFTDYYYQGVYKVEQKIMPEERQAALKAVLVEDFYYIDEVKKIYFKEVPNADIEEINAFNLKKMGFLVLSKYVVQNHPSLEAYIEHILTKEDIVDISNYKKHLIYVVMFWNKYMDLRKKLEIIEFEPNQIINFRKLKAFGITKEMIHEYCDEVYEYVKHGEYFSSQSLRRAGFESELYELGFSDWFYANLLISDERFSFSRMFGNIILYKGQTDMSIKAFEESIIMAHKCIDIFDLMTEMTEVYGCKITDKNDLVYKIQGSEAYFDKILQRFYPSEEAYYQDLDIMGEF